MATSGLGNVIGGFGGSLGTLFGSRKPPKAIQHRLAGTITRPLAAYGKSLIPQIGGRTEDAYQSYLGEQPRMKALAGQQENVLNQLLQKNLAYDPNAQLKAISEQQFGLIDPNVVSPLAKFDVDQQNLARRARGLNPAAVDSTSERLRNARVASQRYYDVARDAYAAIPALYNQAFGQQQASQANAAGYVPQIAQGYENVANRPNQAITNLLNQANALTGTQGGIINQIMAGTQGYQQPQNWADRVGAASQEIGQGIGGLAQMAGGGSV